MNGVGFKSTCVRAATFSTDSRKKLATGTLVRLLSLLLFLCLGWHNSGMLENTAKPLCLIVDEHYALKTRTVSKRAWILIDVI